jgi:hypothetical protein
MVTIYELLQLSMWKFVWLCVISVRQPTDFVLSIFTLQKYEHSENA